MSELAFTPLPHLDQRLLRVVGKIVPVTEREEWTRTWHAELWCLRHSARYMDLASAADLSVGMTHDAIWLRADFLRRGLAGTPAFCLGSLLTLTIIFSGLSAGIAGTWSAFELSLTNHLELSVVTGVLVLLVTLATTFRRRVDQGISLPFSATVQRIVFFLSKVALVWFLALVLSASVSILLENEFPVVADILHLLNFVICMLAGLRWALSDQEARCKQCLHALTTPARIGRPSRNLLEWNGMELSCKQGHGLLSVPEMETSWCETSQWVVSHISNDQAF